MHDFLKDEVKWLIFLVHWKKARDSGTYFINTVTRRMLFDWYEIETEISLLT
jgi:hypothetical protein